jgi:hypothetical protein
MQEREGRSTVRSTDTPFVESMPSTTAVIYAAYIAAGAAALSAVVSFVSSRLSNRNARQQLETQLKHDAEQRDRDRAMTLRRDVYLPAIEAVVRSHAALGHAANLDSDIAASGKQLVTDLAEIAKVHLVASEATVKAIMAFTNALMPAYLELAALRIPLTVIARD